MEGLKKAIAWVVNLGGFMEGHRSQILAATKGVLAALGFFHVAPPWLDVEKVQHLLDALLTWTLALKANKLVQSLNGGAK